MRRACAFISQVDVGCRRCRFCSCGLAMFMFDVRDHCCHIYSTIDCALAFPLTYVAKAQNTPHSSCSPSGFCGIAPICTGPLKELRAAIALWRLLACCLRAPEKMPCSSACAGFVRLRMADPAFATLLASGRRLLSDQPTLSSLNGSVWRLTMLVYPPRGGQIRGAIFARFQISNLLRCNDVARCWRTGQQCW
jgi:hypothetical protein